MQYRNIQIYIVRRFGQGIRLGLGSCLGRPNGCVTNNPGAKLTMRENEIDNATIISYRFTQSQENWNKIVIYENGTILCVLGDTHCCLA